MDRISATRKTYLEDSYTVSFQAELLSCEKLANGRVAAILDQTYFYPTSGGQLTDRGTIEGAQVVDVWEGESDVVYHGLTQDVPPGPVRCQLDWDRRFDHMQQHTGQHVLSRAFIEIANLETVSFHMGDENCTIDLTGPQLDRRIVASAEALANQVVWQDRDVLVRTMSSSELDEASLRKKLPDDVQEVRLVEVAGFDVIGCCGTHVRSTGELGIIKVLKHEKSKGANRVTFKVGQRAFEDFCEKHEIVKQLANQFTTSVDGLAEAIQKIQIEGQRHRKELQRLSKRVAVYEVEDLLQGAEEHKGIRYVAQVMDDCDETHLRVLASELKKRENTVSVIASRDGVVICNAPDDVHIDFTGSAVEPAKALGGSGGGKGGFATVRLPQTASVAKFVEQVFEAIRTAE